MPYREMKLGHARKLVQSGQVNAEQLVGLEDWPDDAVITVPVTDKFVEPVKPGRKAKPAVNQEEASPAEPSPEPA